MEAEQILEKLSEQMDRLMLEPLSPAEEKMRNALACVIAILLTQYKTH